MKLLLKQLIFIGIFFSLEIFVCYEENNIGIRIINYKWGLKFYCTFLLILVSFTLKRLLQRVGIKIKFLNKDP
jgi:hypothetical protein